MFPKNRMFIFFFLLFGLNSYGSQLAQHVFILSIDGGKPSVIQKANMPTLSHLANKGAVSWKAKTIFPSITLPSHVSMLTGVGPFIHQVTWNNWDPEKGYISRETIFTVAKRHGLVNGFFSGKEKFRHFDAPGTLDQFFYQSDNAVDIAQKAALYITEKKPNLTFIHFPDADNAGHKSGWGSSQQVRALERINQAINIIYQAIENSGISQSSMMIITADHGGLLLGHGSQFDHDMIIPWIAWGASVKRGHILNDSIRTMDTAATALWALGIDTPPDWEGKPVKDAFVNPQK
jgi:predicted AlkP superfamily pyrophosphatase or phosphodiesterase